MVETTLIIFPNYGSPEIVLLHRRIKFTPRKLKLDFEVIIVATCNKNAVDN